MQLLAPVKPLVSPTTSLRKLTSISKISGNVFHPVSKCSGNADHTLSKLSGNVVHRQMSCRNPIVHCIDKETNLATTVNNSYTKLKIAVVGFGNFGQFLAKKLVLQGHTVIAYSRSDYSHISSNLVVTFFSDPDELCNQQPEVIVLCTSIRSAESVLKSLPLERLNRSPLFVDVLSVKEFPKRLFLQCLPQDFDILCTHPMFGPESGKNGWGGLPLVYDKVRLREDEGRIRRCESFLDVFTREGCRVVEMSCAQHDVYTSGSQFITHFLGRMLEQFHLESTPINTKGYENLLNLVENTSKDSFELFFGLFLYNKNAMEQMHRLSVALDTVQGMLFKQMHSMLRDQMSENLHKGGLDECE